MPGGSVRDELRRAFEAQGGCVLGYPGPHRRKSYHHPGRQAFQAVAGRLNTLRVAVSRYEAQLTNHLLTREHDELLSVAVSTMLSPDDLRALVSTHWFQFGFVLAKNYMSGLSSLREVRRRLGATIP